MTLAVKLVALLLFAMAGTGEAQPLSDCGDCAYGPARTKLCDDHEAEERAGLSKAKQAFKGGTERERLRALRKAARLTNDHPNCPSRAVAKFLGKGLEVESFKVRDKTIGYLLDGQHPDEAVKILLAEFGRVRKALNKLGPAIKTSAKLRGKTSKKSAAIFQKIQALPDLTSYAMNLVAALGALPDKRCEIVLVDGLRESFKKAPALLQVAAAGSLIQFESLEALQAVVEFQGRLASDLERGKLPRRYPPGKAYTALDLWLGFDRELRQGDFDLVAEALAKALEAKGVKDFPGAGQADVADWKLWLGKNKSVYPAQLDPDLKVAQRLKVPLLTTKKAEPPSSSDD